MTINQKSLRGTKVLFLAATVILSGCSASQAHLNDAIETASGAMHDARETVEDVTEAVQNTVDEINNKWSKVQSGAVLLKKGVDELKGAVE